MNNGSNGNGYRTPADKRTDGRRGGFSKKARIAIVAGVLSFVAFYAFVTLASGDHEVIGLVWQLAIILGAAAVFSFFMWRSLRRR